MMTVANLFFCFLFAVFAACDTEVENNRPIIGILAQEIAYSLDQIYPGKYTSYIAASYVKFVEGGGARVVPVWIGRDKQYYTDIVNKTNGLLLPGGSTWFNQSNGYADAGVILYNLAIELNNRGVHYPIFGTCLGMELMIYAAAASTECRSDCSAKKIGLALEFKPDFKNSKIFGNAPDDVIESLKTKNITYNYHQYCVTEKALTDLKLTRDWHVLSVNKDLNNLEFISSLESRKYPFFGVQFHPEKNIYEWKPNHGNLHMKESVVSGQYFAQMFVNEARKNNHSFENYEAEQRVLIYNYPAKYTGRDGSGFEQCYLFNDKTEQNLI